MAKYALSALKEIIEKSNVSLINPYFHELIYEIGGANKSIVLIYGLKEHGDSSIKIWALLMDVLGK